MRDLTKRYDKNIALDHVSLDFLPGEVHVLFGENGAGKSTLISIVAGANAPSDGYLEIGDKKGAFQSVGESQACGIRAVFQEFSLIPYRTVAENIVLGAEPLGRFGLLSKSAARDEARQLIADLGFNLDVDARIASLTRGKQQMVEICKAFRRPPRLLILDEPTASLSEQDSLALLELLRRFRANGTAVIYVTHRMHEIPAIGDKVSVLRDGQLIATVGADTEEDELIRLMTGRQMSKIYPKPRDPVGDVGLALENVTLAAERGVTQVRNASVSVRAGEIVGIAGLVGCGKSELAQACFGLRKITGGTLRIKDEEVRIATPGQAIDRGLWYSPSDRRQEGLALNRSVRENISLSSYSFGPLKGWWNKPARESQLLADLAGQVELDPGRLNHAVGDLSGGNQQKVLFAKSLGQEIDVFVFDEPTVGVDIGACLSIYKCLAALSAKGAAILLVSSNLPELMGLTHRMLVMSEGRFVAEFQRDDYDEHRILEQFF
ncbi:sugar ABC transporter ATP-binding protein [Frigidibacter sp. SD6-1]|uniref:sugar ABC transporter ATP-binding protein n=1 Tax=Frigidibacter sp. SD6-1 TaxID=3032581 RepID=UPI0024E03328|nr:sugar ABC transporter ATP-binding protein [Frigidibacter sp. SD6-1]